MVSKLMRQQHSALCTLAREKPKARNLLLLKAKRPIIDALSECALNVLKGSVKLSDKQKTKLRRFRHYLRELAKKRVSLKKKKEISQRGGFIPALLGAILPVIGSLIGKAISRK